MATYDLAYTGPQIDELLASIKGLGLRLGGVLTPGATIETPLVDTFWFAPAGTYTYGESQTYTVNTGYLGIIQYMTGTEAWSTQQVLIGTDAAALAACQAAVDNINDVIFESESVDINIFTKVKGTLNASGGYTHITSTPPSASSYVRIIFIPVNPNEIYILTQDVTAGTQYYSIIDNMFDVNTDQAQSNIDYATGYNGRVQLSAGSSVKLTIPNDGHFLIVRADETGGAAFAPTLTHIVSLDKRVKKINDNLLVKKYADTDFFDKYVFAIINGNVTYIPSTGTCSQIIPVEELVAVDIVGSHAGADTKIPPLVFLRGKEPTQANWIAGSEIYGTISTGVTYTRRLTLSSIVIPAEATHAIVQNINTTSTNSYALIYDINYIREEISKLKSRAVVVDANGNGDFTTIASAIDATSDGDTIIVNSGTYDEIIHAWDKDRHIVGVCRETCILTNGTGRYDTPPLEMNIGSIENMTIIADNYDSTIVDPTTQQERTSYAIHIEHAYPTPFRLVIRHCTIISKWNAAIGAGVRYNQELIIEDCDLKTECVQAWSEGQSAFKSFGAIFFHNDVGASNTQTGHFVLKNCRLRGVNYALSYVPQANRPYLEVEYINNNLCTTNNGVTNIVDNWQPSVTGMIYKSVCCYGNNIAELNA